MTDYKWRIYGLKDPRNLQIRYVGVVISERARLARHIGEARRGKCKTHKCNWIRSILSDGLLPIEITLEEGCGDSWREAECRWIEEIGKIYPLTNATAGGLGSVGFKHSEETKEKISKAKSNPSEETRKLLGHRKGIKLSDDHRLKISDSLRGKKRPNVVVRKRSFSTEEACDIIRRYNNGESQTSMARLYGLTAVMIGCICLGKSYKDAMRLYLERYGSAKGVDCNNFYPYSLEEIRERLEPIPFNKYD